MGPLNGWRVIEIAGIGPGQLCGMLLADMGASVLRVTRIGQPEAGVDMPARFNLMNRSRPAIAVDLKHAAGVALLLGLCARADALYEGFRPGVMERLGLGPDEVMARNPRIVYGRVTGWGQQGPLAQQAGHDTNYLALTGALASIGERDGPPVLPLNLVADFGGGGLYLAVGLLAAMLEASRSGQGQVVDAAMVDGVASMLTAAHGLLAAGLWQEARGSNLVDGGAPFMRCYQTKDGRYVAVAALEGRFFGKLLAGLGLDDVDPAARLRRADWPALEKRLDLAFRNRTRDEWTDVFAGSDACVTPVLSLSEAARHPHSAARNAYLEIDGIVQPAPAPRFSRTPSRVTGPPPEPGRDALEVLADWGVPAQEAERLGQAGVLLAG